MAAGLGFIEFTTGDVLTAAAANGYLASQVVMVFADSAARTTAITSPQEGMISFLKDTDSTEYYSGSAWEAIGGGSSPLTTKGDLYTFDTADARLGVGANGTVLTADSAEATGLKWVAPSGGGVTFSGVLLTNTTFQSIANNTATAITWSAEDYDTDSYHSTVTNTSRITIPAGKAGYFTVGGFFQINTQTTGRRSVTIRKNGTTVKQWDWTPSSIEPTVGFSTPMNLAEADYVELFFLQTQGVSINVYPYDEYGAFYANYLGA